MAITIMQPHNRSTANGQRRAGAVTPLVEGQFVQTGALQPPLATTAPMLRHYLAQFFAWLILACPPSACLAQDQPQWKLKEGDVFFLKQTRQTEQKVNVQESILRQEMKSATVSEFTVLKPGAGGSLVLQQKFVSLSVNVPEGSAGIKDMLDRAAGVPLTFHLDSNRHITKLEGYDTLLQKLVKADADLEKTARQALPEAELHLPVQQLFDFLPTKAPAKGESWDSSAAETFGAFGLLKLKSKWSLADSAADPNLIRIAGQQSATLDIAKASKGLPFQMKAGAVKKSDSKVDVLFDVSKGRLSKRTTTRHLLVHLLMEKDQRILDMQIEQNATTTLAVSDKKPAE